jgi:hypothetical protein
MRVAKELYMPTDGAYGGFESRAVKRRTPIAREIARENTCSPILMLAVSGIHISPKQEVARDRERADLTPSVHLRSYFRLRWQSHPRLDLRGLPDCKAIRMGFSYLYAVCSWGHCTS